VALKLFRPSRTAEDAARGLRHGVEAGRREDAGRADEGPVSRVRFAERDGRVAEGSMFDAVVRVGLVGPALGTDERAARLAARHAGGARGALTADRIGAPGRARIPRGATRAETGRSTSR